MNEYVKTIAARVDEDLFDKIDKYRLKLAKSVPGSNPSISDAVRALVEIGLDHVKNVRTS